MSSPNTTPLTYNGYVTQIATLAVVNTTTSGGVVVGVDAAFNNLIPQMLNYAELRIQRDVDLLPLLTTNTIYNLSIGSNILTMSINDFVTIQTMSIVSGTATIPLLPVTKEFIQNNYNDSAAINQGPPQYFAMYGGDATGGTQFQYVTVGPYPDQAYPILFTGTIRSPSLNSFASPAYAGTSTTFISTYLPDMLLMASMVYLSAFQRNFGRQADDPAMAQSYENQYQMLLKSAITEEYRKKLAADAWSSTSTSPVATPTR